jgi:hypothetical protein
VASSTTKRALIYRFDRQPLEAIVNPGEYLQEDHIEVMTAGGSLQRVAYAELKAACFAKEPARPDLFTSDNLFERRPKLAGLWTRFVFRDGDLLEGVLPHNLLDWPSQGYLVTPPRAGLTRQLVFIPRPALTETHLLGVMGTLGREKRTKPEAVAAGQLSMFDG